MNIVKQRPVIQRHKDFKKVHNPEKFNLLFTALTVVRTQMAFVSGIIREQDISSVASIAL